MKQALWCLLKYWRRHPLQAALSVLGIALGVAVVTAMDLANASALASFRQSVTAVTGEATHQVAPTEATQTAGVPEDIFPTVLRTNGVRAAAPVIEAHVLLLSSADAILGNTPEDERQAVRRGDASIDTRSAFVRVLGVDPFYEDKFRAFSGGGKAQFGENIFIDWTVRDDGCVLPQSLADALHIKVGDGVTVMYATKRHALTLLGTYTPTGTLARGSDDVLVMDIAAAQERFGTLGRLSSIDLILPEGAAGDAVAAHLQRQLPAGIQVQRPSERVGRTEAMLQAFQLNLRALSLLALVVGIFLIHNTLTVAVLQRIPMIGTLRCLGVSAGEISRAILCEALFMGVLGSALGLLAGTALAGIFLQRVGGTVADLYAYIGAFSILYDQAALAKGAALGLLAALAGAYFPAREAGSVRPVQVLRRSRLEAKARASWRTLGVLGGISFVVALGLAVFPGQSPVPGLAAAFALALGGALCSPAVTRAFSLIAVRPLQSIFGTLGALATRGITTNLSRTGLAVGALSLALSMTIGVALMISSFRSTLDKWMDQAINADIYIRPAGPTLMRHKVFMPEETLGKIRAHPAVAAVDTYRGRDVPLEDGSLVLVVATDIRTTFSRGRARFPFLKGESEGALQGQLRGEVLISESLARKKGLDIGDEFKLAQVERPLKVAAIYYEYTVDRGVISMDVNTYKALFGDARANSASLYLKDGADLEKVRQELRAEVGAAAGLYLFSNRSLRDEAFRVFDRTFAITGQLESLSLAVGLCGILAALLALLRERSTDFGLLRALGLTANGLLGLVVLEGILLGLVAFLVACVLGPALSLLLIHVINVRAFGWTIFFSVNPEVFVRVGVLALLMSALAGLYPSWRARRMSMSAALREE